MRRLLGAVAVALLAVGMAGCSTGTKSATSAQQARSTTTTHFVKLQAGGLTVTPSADLDDGQQVTVSVKGFLPSRKFYLSECLSPIELKALGCGAQLAAQPFGLTDSNGMGSTTFTARSAASTGPLISSVEACTGQCVIVATAGSSGVFYFAPITFAPPTVASGTPPCGNGQIAVSDTGGGAGLGHVDQVLVFTNTSHAACTLTGFPGVAGLNSIGQDEVQATRTLGGYLGGLLPGETTLPVVSLTPGQTASAIVEGTDNPIGSQPCARFQALLVTPPNLTEEDRVGISLSGMEGFPSCSRLEVHPVVAGSSGSSPGF